MKHLMLDLETLGTTPGCSVLSIGACMFDPNSIVIGEQFHVTVSRQSCLELGLFEDPMTMQWWEKQSEEVRAAAFSGATALPDAVTAFYRFWLDNEAEYLWCHGPSFDEPILAAAFKACGNVHPWGFWSTRCTRTVYHWGGVSVDRSIGTHHNALDDAIQQARAVSAAVAKIGVPFG